MKSNSDLYISKGHKSFWKLLFPYSFLALALYCVFRMFKDLSVAEPEETLSYIMTWMTCVFFLTLIGLYFARVKDYHFDFRRKRYKTVTRVGPMGYGRWKNFENLEYVGVWENLDMLYQINLWYNKNQHFELDTFWNREEAFEVGKDIAENLGIEFYNGVDVLDYTVEELKLEDEVKVPGDQRRIDVHISQGNRPVWQTFIAASFLTAAIVLLFVFIEGIEVGSGRKYMEPIWLELAGLLFLTGLSFASVQDYEFDFKNNQFKHIYRVGPFRYGVWEAIESLDYISVFQYKPNSFQVNLWYNTNVMVNFGVYGNIDNAIKAAKRVATQLNIDVWDATNPHDAKWHKD